MAIAIVFTLMLAACGGGGSGSIDVGSTVTNAMPGVVVFGGSIGDGPVGVANVTALSAQGGTLGTITSDSNASYKAHITPAESDYPVQLVVNRGTSRGNYSGSYDQTNGAATSATVSNLASGTYYLAMSTYDTSGREGPRSTEVTKSVP